MNAVDDDYPCVGICMTDPDSGYCLGCGRPPLAVMPADPMSGPEPRNTLDTQRYAFVAPEQEETGAPITR